MEMKELKVQYKLQCQVYLGGVGMPTIYHSSVGFNIIVAHYILRQN